VNSRKNAKSERVKLDYEEIQVQNTSIDWAIYVSKNQGAVSRPITQKVFLDIRNEISLNI
jgi:hypothetical protein